MTNNLGRVLLVSMGGGTVLWNVTTGKPSRLVLGGVATERELEDWIEHDATLIASDLVILARQLMADGKPLDLLALDADGNLVVIELKRGDAYREALAQGLDYAAWIAEQSAEQLRSAIDKNRKKDGFFNETLAKHLGAPAAEKWSPQEVDVRLVVAGTGADDRLNHRSRSWITEGLEKYGAVHGESGLRSSNDSTREAPCPARYSECHAASDVDSFASAERAAIPPHPSDSESSRSWAPAAA